MNENVLKFREEIKNKKVAVIGLGISNTPLIKFLSINGALVTACDRKEKDELGELYKNLMSYVYDFSLGENYLSNLRGFDYIFRTPGMRYDKPELIEAQCNGSIITSEMELFFKLCPCEIFGITGSDGKTTTTTLIYLLLKQAGYNCWLGGNIGTSLIDKVEQIFENDKVVLELSSFQLHTLKESPHVSVITNISPNHLDYHTSYEEYIEAKTNIFLHQKSTDKLILNYDNEVTRNFIDRAKGEVIYFSRVNSLNNGFIVKNNAIIKVEDGREYKILNTSDIQIPGVHNVENYLAAIAATDGYISIEDVKKVAVTFKGVEHRIEFVRELNGVKFFNDSIASSPTRTICGLNSFDQKVILIAGGYDKKIPFDELGKVITEKVKLLLLIGKTSDNIESAVRRANPDFPIHKCSSLEEAVAKAYSNAQKGDIIILSPACASFDMFKNFEERGKIFKDIVYKLK